MSTVPLPPVSRVGILAKSNLRAATTHLVEIGEWLTARGITPLFETATAALMPPGQNRAVLEKPILAVEADIVLVLGGDGTLLGMADCIGEAGSGIPIIGVNFGSLGFLTEVTLPELYRSLDAALTGRARVEERLMLRTVTTRNGQPFAQSIAVNDTVITKTARSRMIDLSVYVGDEFVTRVKADGLIIATPTGSTAYNMAAGGPIVVPGHDAMTMTPICAHALTNRPLVIQESATIRLQLGADVRGVILTVDAQWAHSFLPGDTVEMTAASTPLILYASPKNFFDIMRDKLHWGARSQRKEDA
jgi:NAD+ kinase